MAAHQPGAFCWIELATSDAAGARKFYSDLFGWTTSEQSMGEMGTYYVFQKDGKDVAAMYQQAGDPQGTGPNWLSYVSVASADDAAARATSLGAQGVNGPFDVADLGRMAVIKDPQGAHIAVWQGKSHGGVQLRDEQDSLCWNELHAHDLSGARSFYTALFKWRAKESPDYTEWHLGEHAIGGMIAMHGPPNAPAAWMPYFAVADCDAAASRAAAGGAQVCVEPRDIEKVGRFAVLIDPQGAMFAVIKLDS
ncbi:MAG TPA: VOC family protein [Thermoanaerobaculia bacterium]|nr:VOC family protein [Thermoanaerobaculia bacterium]